MNQPDIKEDIQPINDDEICKDLASLGNAAKLNSRILSVRKVMLDNKDKKKEQ